MLFHEHFKRARLRPLHGWSGVAHPSLAAGGSTRGMVCARLCQTRVNFVLHATVRMLVELSGCPSCWLRPIVPQSEDQDGIQAFGHANTVETSPINHGPILGVSSTIAHEFVLRLPVAKPMIATV